MFPPSPPGPDPVDLRVVPRLRGQLRRRPVPEGGAAERSLVGDGHVVAPRVRVQGGNARTGLAVLRGRRLREVSWSDTCMHCGLV